MKQKPSHLLLRILSQSSSDAHWANRRAVGLGVFFGFLFGLIGFMFTGTAWWFTLPLIGFFLAWRMAYGYWPFQKPEE